MEARKSIILRLYFSQQGFFSTAFGVSSGAVVTFMSVDRVASLYRPFLYKQYATPRVARIFCIFLTLFCLTMSALPFVGVGRYIFNTSSRYFCQFDWFPVDLPGTVYILAIGVCGALIISLMTFSNIVVFVIVVRIRRRMTKVLPSGRDETRRRARRVAFRQEERMAKFVALASVVFLVTWLPVTVSHAQLLRPVMLKTALTDGKEVKVQVQVDYKTAVFVSLVFTEGGTYHTKWCEARKPLVSFTYG